MHCPFCNKADTKVTDSRLAAEGAQVRRRRQCLACGERFTTFEICEILMPRIAVLSLMINQNSDAQFHYLYKSVPSVLMKSKHVSAA